MKVDEIILEGPKWDKAANWAKNSSAANWAKNKAKMAVSSLGNAFGVVGDREHNAAKSKNEIDSWAKQVLGQWGKIEAGLQNNIGILSDNNTQEYADQLSKWLKTYFRLSNTDLTNYSIATDGEFSDDNILKYIKKAYSIRLSPDYLEKVTGNTNQSSQKTNDSPQTKTTNRPTKLTPGKTYSALDGIEYQLMWVGPADTIIKDPYKINEISHQATEKV